MKVRILSFIPACYGLIKIRFGYHKFGIIDRNTLNMKNLAK